MVPLMQVTVIGATVCISSRSFSMSIFRRLYSNLMRGHCINREPEAAAVHCAHLTNLHQLRPSQNFMICDAGGGTVVRSVESCDPFFAGPH